MCLRSTLCADRDKDNTSTLNIAILRFNALKKYPPLLRKLTERSKNDILIARYCVTKKKVACRDLVSVILRAAGVKPWILLLSFAASE